MPAEFTLTEDELQERVERFDATWQSGQPAEIEDFLLPSESKTGGSVERREVLIELVMLDLEYRWRRRPGAWPDDEDPTDRAAASAKRGLPFCPLLEDYVDRYPELGREDELPNLLVSDEYRVRQRWGDRPHRDEYRRRFPGRGRALDRELDRVDELVRSQAQSCGLHTRCPHCHDSVFLEEDTLLSRICCPSCGSNFSVLTDERLAEDARKNRSIGRFELVERLGTGSFGTVWKARDTQLDRLVAVKIPHQGRLGLSDVEQVLREARAAAQLSHPSIVSVHEVGREGDTIFIVSDVAPGMPLSERVKLQPMTAREAVRLCETIARALHHAHEAGVVHRDLKPQNIIVGPDGEPHLTDFGLARREAGEVTLTYDGQMLGTPAYMSPELAQGEAHHADRRSDVYALGVILFELLTGELPFRGNVRMLMHQVVHDAAPSPRTFNSHVSRDLETICLKCLEKDPRHRYSAALELADELRRFLDGQPIQTRPVSKAARFRKWCGRNPVTASLIAALMSALVAGLSGITWQWAHATAEAERFRRLLYVSDISKIADSWERGSVGTALGLLKRHVPQPGEQDLRGFEWYYLWRLCQPSLRARTFQHEPVFAMAVSPDGRKLAAAGGPGTVRLWDLQTCEALHTLKGHEHIVVGLAFSPNGQWLASGSADTRTLLWKVSTGERVGVLEGGSGRVQFSPNGRVQFSPNGRVLGVCSGEGIALWDVSSIHNVQKLHFIENSAPVWSVAFSADGAFMVSGGQDGEVRLWNVASGQPMEPSFKGHSGIVYSVDLSPDGKTVVSSSADKTVRLWDVSTRMEQKKLQGHSGYVMSVAFSPDGAAIISGSHDGTAKLWDVASGQLRDTIRGHRLVVDCVAFSPDGRTVFTGSWDGTVKQWNLAAREHPTTLEGNGGVVASPVAFAPNGRILAAARRGSDVALWDVESGREVATFTGHNIRIGDVDFAPDGKAVASATGRETKLWDVDTLHVLHDFSGSAPVAFSPVGNVLATGGSGGTIQLWDVATGELQRTLPGSGRRLNCVAFSADGTTLASGDEDGSGRCFKLWDIRMGEEIAAPEGHTGPVDAIAYSPAGDKIATAGFDGMLRLWDSTTGTELDTRIDGGHVARIKSVAFSADGRTLASGAEDGTIKLWHVGTGGHLATLEGHQASVVSVAFSPDARTLASGSGDGTIRLWKAATREESESAAW